MYFFLLELGGETSNEWIVGLVLIIVYFMINIGTFRLCRQDIIRSVIFGMCSTLLPAGNMTFSFFFLSLFLCFFLFLSLFLFFFLFVSLFLCFFLFQSKFALFISALFLYLPSNAVLT